MFNKHTWYELKRILLSVFFPNRCPFCNEIIESRKYYCDSCYRYLPFVFGEIKPPQFVSRFYACCYYCRRARKAVHMLKFSGVIYPADAFALMMSRKLGQAEADVLIPVPSGISSIRKRGFSTADLLAKRISIWLNIPIMNAVCAVRDKKEQKTLSAAARHSNAKKSFYLDGKLSVRGKRVILIDDVSTTGSTLSAIAELLHNAGAADVQAAVFAKTTDVSKNSRIIRRYSVIRK